MGRLNIEMAIQRELIKWIAQKYPTVECAWFKNEGKKSILTATLDKKSGLVSGIPDLILFKAHQGITYILHLELKKKKGTLNDNQRIWWSRFISTKNRKGAIAYGYEQAQNAVINWLSGLNENS